MKIWLKAGVILTIAVLLVSSIYVVFYSEPEEETPDETEDSTDETDETNEDNNDDEETDDEDDFVAEHTVFIEEASYTTCKPCIGVAEILHELYDPDVPDFYYVSMVEDENTKAYNRVHDDYNIWGFPTVFIDGGYKVVMGGKEKSEYQKKISEAKSRDVPKLLLNINSTWKQNKTELTTTVIIENKESDTYDGLLKVYVTEIKSRWSDYSGNPYHFAFLDYAMSKNIKLEPDENKSFSETWTGTYTNIYPENLWVIAVVFNSDSEQAYSDSPSNKNSFDAYYADAADATRVAEGALPPSIGISSPKAKNRYILGKEMHPFLGTTLLKKPVIIGKITIKAKAEAEAGVEKVEFTIKGGLFGRETTETVTSEPYEWTWDKFAIGRYTITVKVYDSEGKTATDSVDVVALIFKQGSN